MRMAVSVWTKPTPTAHAATAASSPSVGMGPSIGDHLRQTGRTRAFGEPVAGYRVRRAAAGDAWRPVRFDRSASRKERRVTGRGSGPVGALVSGGCFAAAVAAFSARRSERRVTGSAGVMCWSPLSAALPRPGPRTLLSQNVSGGFARAVSSRAGELTGYASRSRRARGAAHQPTGR